MSNLALITGGQKGIGLGIARVLAAEGWRVALASSSPEESAAVQDSLQELGSAACYYQHDLRNT